MLRSKQVIITFLFKMLCIPSIGQEKAGSFDPGLFYPNDIAVTHFDQYRNQYHYTFQSGNDITRLLLDTSFQIIQTNRFTSKEISYFRKGGSRKCFTQYISLKDATYEVFIQNDTLSILLSRTVTEGDSLMTTMIVEQSDKDERILAILPLSDKVGILTGNFKKDKLTLITWSPTNGQHVVEFPLPDSNMDKSFYKEYPKETRINFSKQLINPVVLPMGQISVYSRPGPQLYYSDTEVYILMNIPFALGVFTIHLNLNTNQITTHNYEINSLITNAGNDNTRIMHPSACIADSFLIVKNLSVNKYQYLFYDLRSHELIKRMEATTKDIETLVHSTIRQKGTWASAKEEKEFEKKEAYFKKGNGILFVSGIDKDSISVTSLLVLQTTGITGSLLDFLAPMPLDFSSKAGYYLSLLIPPLGSKRDRLIFFHSRFSLRDFQPSSGKNVRTLLDSMVDEAKNDELWDDLCFFVRKKAEFYIGSYSTEDKKIHVIRYREKQY
ncbi:MAG TPA: hypothetical protein PLO99_11655 [Chitinophagaceae bacterium]|nr:hypothetical protein [Chitinophagaceae bacterium]